MKFASLFLFLSVLVVAVKANGSAREAIEYFLSEVGRPVFKGKLQYDNDQYRSHVSQEIGVFTGDFKQRFLGVDYEERLPVICRDVLNRDDNLKAAGCSVAMTIAAFEKLWIEVMTGKALDHLKHLGERVLTYDLVFKGIEDFLNTRRASQHFDRYIPSALVLNLCHQLVPKLIGKYGRLLVRDERGINAGCKDLMNTWNNGQFPPQ